MFAISHHLGKNNNDGIKKNRNKIINKLFCIGYIFIIPLACKRYMALKMEKENFKKLTKNYAKIWEYMIFQQL